ncbi:hypothetical protein T08_9677 [Trichinella sp. T8]|nr:hypothetical protein T08_9677 [Trichinella sp. T8]
MECVLMPAGGPMKCAFEVYTCIICDSFHELIDT